MKKRTKQKEREIAEVIREQREQKRKRNLQRGYVKGGDQRIHRHCLGM